MGKGNKLPNAPSKKTDKLSGKSRENKPPKTRRNKTGKGNKLTNAPSKKTGKLSGKGRGNKTPKSK